MAGFFLCLAACSPAMTPTPPPTETPRPNALPTLAELPPESTLPPTWTPTYTPSPEPPTVTPSPTLTLSPEPTLSAEEICATLEILYEIPNARRIANDKIIPVGVMIPVPDVLVEFTATHRQSATGQGLRLQGGGMVIAEFPLRTLSETGAYDWRLAIVSDAYGDLCVHEGRFILTQATATAEETAEPDTDS